MELAVKTREILKEYNVLRLGTPQVPNEQRLETAMRIVDEIHTSAMGPFGPAMTDQQMLDWIEQNM